MAITFDWDNRRRRAIISGEHFDEIRERFSAANEAAKFARYRNRFMPSRTYAITQGGRFDIGLYSDIVKYIKEQNYNIRIRRTKIFEANFETVCHPDAKLAKLNLKLRDYQRDVVKKCFEYGRGTVVLATAGGKTLTIATLLETIYKKEKKFKCALIVPDLSLVEQTSKDFADYGVSFSFSKWTGKNELNLGKNVIICNMAWTLPAGSPCWKITFLYT